MSKKADTWMPLYVGEYLADTTNLNTEQHGAYFLMLLAAWKRGGKLPYDDGQLTSITKLSPARWKAHRSILLELFRIEGDALLHKRVTEEREKAQLISDKKSKTGAEGAAKRWQKDASGDGEGNGKPMAKGMAKDMANASQTDAPSPSPLPVPSEQKEPANAGLSAAEPPTGPALVLVGEEPPADGVPPCPHRRLIALFVAKLPELPKPRAELWINGQGAEDMRQRWKWLLTATRENGSRYATTAEEGMEWFSTFFEQVAESDFLTGRSGKWKDCSLAWLMKRQKFTNIVEGQYQGARRVA